MADYQQLFILGIVAIVAVVAVVETQISLPAEDIVGQAARQSSSNSKSSVILQAIDSSGSHIEPECNDRIDNDGDGTCDFTGCTVGRGRKRLSLVPDPDCMSSSDNNEQTEYPDLSPVNVEYYDENENLLDPINGIQKDVTYHEHVIVKNLGAAAFSGQFYIQKKHTQSGAIAGGYNCRESSFTLAPGESIACWEETQLNYQMGSVVVQDYTFEIDTNNVVVESDESNNDIQVFVNFICDETTLEVCGDNFDNNCDGIINEGCSALYTCVGPSPVDIDVTTTTGVYGLYNGTPYNNTDTCTTDSSGNPRVIEWYCLNDIPDSQSIGCGFDCVDGACTIPEGSCTDSDGFDLTVQGTVSGTFEGESYSNTDYCKDSTKVWEWLCSSGSVNYPYKVDRSCSSGCSEGRCN